MPLHPWLSMRHRPIPVRLRNDCCHVGCEFAVCRNFSGSAAALAYLVATDSRRAKPVDGAAQFRRHLAALSDDSREHLREQIRIARDQRQER